MSRSPLRILPLVAVAIGGVIATKAISGAASLPDLLSATRASAEEAPARRHKLNEAAAQAPLQSTAPAAAPKPAPICAPSIAELAKETGLSPAELNTLQSLQARRGQLDERERAIETQRQLVAAAELKLDAKLRALNALRDQLKSVMSEADQKKQAEVDRLVKVYEKMKPRDAGAVMATLDESVRLPVAAKMKEAALAAVLSQMGTLEAKKLTESLARRYAAPDKLAAATVPGQPVVDPLAQSAPAGAEASAEPPKAKPAKPRSAKPVRKAVARSAPKPAPASDDPDTSAKADAPAAAPVASAAPSPAASPAQVAAAGDTRAK